MNKLLPLLLALLLLIPGALGEEASASDVSVPDMYLNLHTPTGWCAEDSANIQIECDSDAGIGAYTVEVKLNDGIWLDVTNRLTSGRCEYPVAENGTVYLRATDYLGNVTYAQAEVKCFDRDAPVVNATVNNQMLHIVVSDPLSGIAGVQVNSLLYTTVENGTVDVDLTGELKHYEKLTVRGFDFCGNFSDLLSLSNPCYEPDPTPTPNPEETVTPATTGSGSASATSKPTQKPKATPAPTASPTPTDAAVSGLAELLSGIYLPSVIPTAPPATQMPMPTPEVEYITLGPGMPYTPEGNGHTLDMLYSAATNKQFISLQTKSGNTFYLIIDYDKPIDEEAELYETYFMNLVDERDILALMDEEEISSLVTPTPEIVYVTPEPTTVPTTAPTAVPSVPDDGKSQQTTAMMALVGLIALAGGGVCVFLKNRKNAQQKPVPDYGLEDDDEDDEEDEENTSDT